jgi:uncharacterized membrane protein (Fun14 family)
VRVVDLLHKEAAGWAGVGYIAVVLLVVMVEPDSAVIHILVVAAAMVAEAAWSALDYLTAEAYNSSRSVAFALHRSLAQAGAFEAGLDPAKAVEHRSDPALGDRYLGLDSLVPDLKGYLAEVVLAEEVVEEEVRAVVLLEEDL